EINGLGERKNEGFGRVKLLDLTEDIERKKYIPPPNNETISYEVEYKNEKNKPCKNFKKFSYCNTNWSTNTIKYAKFFYSDYRSKKIISRILFALNISVLVFMVCFFALVGLNTYPAFD
ncbi:MAG: hypothetical protein U1D98_03400, partial [Candidatus Gracilibacteria bacterium]|nr:hypothetical protein [Candidatus Gracilibacteria bacterium]